MNLLEFTEKLDIIHGQLLEIANETGYNILTNTTIGNPIEGYNTLGVTNMDKSTALEACDTQKFYVDNQIQ